MTIRAALYARVSTAHNSQDPHLQTQELEEYCARRGWTVTGTYVDVGISGTQEKRPNLDRLLADAHRRRFDAVVVWKFDRFARSVSHLLRALETFQALGVEFVSLSEQLDTSTPTGKMVFTVLGAVAELERSLIVERVRAGLRNARAKGKRLGRPRAVVDAARVASLRAQGRSWREISKTVGLPASTVRTVALRATKIPSADHASSGVFPPADRATLRAARIKCFPTEFRCCFSGRLCLSGCQCHSHFGDWCTELIVAVRAHRAGAKTWPVHLNWRAGLLKQLRVRALCRAWLVCRAPIERTDGGILGPLPTKGSLWRSHPAHA